VQLEKRRAGVKIAEPRTSRPGPSKEHQRPGPDNQNRRRQHQREIWAFRRARQLDTGDGWKSSGGKTEVNGKNEAWAAPTAKRNETGTEK
jgi:hypothetical protein